jgi:CheY-like chemotaxis protein
MTNVLVGRRVAVVDDEKAQARTVADVVEDAGMIPLIITEGQGEFTRPQDLMDRIVNQSCFAVVCDHRLYEKPFASFNGAEFLAQSFRAKIPGLLLSSYAADDAPTSIRLHRADIPSVMPREDLEPDGLSAGLLRCRAEILGTTVPERISWRVMVRVVSVAKEGNESVVRAVMHTWDPDKEVQFPLELIQDPKVKESLPIGFNGATRLFADVNIECLDEDELFFKNFEPAPEPGDFEFST